MIANFRDRRALSDILLAWVDSRLLGLLSPSIISENCCYRLSMVGQDQTKLSEEMELTALIVIEEFGCLNLTFDSLKAIHIAVK